MRIEHTGQRLDTFEFLRLHQASVSNASSISYDSASRELLLEVVYPETGDRGILPRQLKIHRVWQLCSHF